MSREKTIGSVLRREKKRIWDSCPGLGMQALWERAAGPEAASNTSVISMRKGIMTVSCATGGWACELKLKSRELASDINRLNPPEKVSEIRFVHSALRGEKTRK